jgi:hypothetical protein
MNYYKGQKGFSYFFTPNRLLELLPKMGGHFALELWLMLHSRIQHNQVRPCALLADDQIAAHPMWAGRSINPTEISRARSLLKELGLLTYRKDGIAFWYFVTNPLTGIPIDAEQAKLEQQGSTEASKVAKLQAKVEALEKQLQTRLPTTVVVPAKKAAPVYDDDRFPDTGFVEDEELEAGNAEI